VSIWPLLDRREGRARALTGSGRSGSQLLNHEEIRPMRFMILRKADKNTEASVLPSEDLIAAMGKYNEELVKAGVMQAGEGLQASSKGARVKFSRGKPTVIDGPFAETKELLAGFTMIDVKSKQEAIAWAKRWPVLDGDGEVELEIRQVFEASDFGDEFTPEQREAEERLRDQIQRSGKQLGPRR
jgi:hypothetical protein